MSEIETKHVEGQRMWSFVHGKILLSSGEHQHLKGCNHCNTVFQYFAIYDDPEDLLEKVILRPAA